MCGLAGIFHQQAAARVDAALLRRMTTALRHRGPDGDGFYLAPGVGLGHRRLAIIDIGGGDQPMYNEDGTVAIVFNGEIYNHAALRQTLLAKGHVFRNRCDTEAIIHAWESWGPDCLQHLSGMFAFALWDSNRRQLFLARDRLGKKPLYYGRSADGTLYFASELAALSVVPDLPRRIRDRAVADFFAYGYVPDPDSIYSDIQKLPAGHCLLLEHGAEPTAPRRYWRPAGTERPLDETEARDELTALLRRQTGARLMSDVPLGAFLSGGVDSSAVVALAATQHDGPLATFTIGFEGAEDESPFAEIVARRYNTAQHTDRTSVDYIDAARTQAGIFGEPFGDHSSVPTHRVCALTRRHVTVALSGDGGDEVFAGYRRYRWHLLTEAVRRFIPAPLRRHAIGRLARAYPKLDRAPRWLRAKTTLTEISLDSALGYFATMQRMQAEQRNALFGERFAARLDGYDPAERIAALMDQSDTDDALRQAQYIDLNTWLVGDILTKVDRTSMANSLEVRCPILDHEVVGFGLSLPASLKLRGGEGKFLLKSAMEPYLPREILYRPKQGFAVALGTRLRRDIAAVRARVLSDPMMDSGFFRRETAARLLDEHESGRSDHAMPLWLLLVFEGFLANMTAPAPATGIAIPA